MQLNKSSESKQFRSKLICVLMFFAIAHVGMGWFLGQFGAGLRINNTNSMPQTLFMSFKRKPQEPLKRGDFVCFKHPLSPQRLTKMVVGLPGDRIDLKDQHVFVNDQDYGAYFLVSPRSGKELNPIQVEQIPDGFVYVHAPHPESFDSRYAEFGLVKIDDIEEVLWPLF